MAFQIKNSFYCSEIGYRLTDLVGTVKRENCLNLESLNIHAEQFYAAFLNLLFGWELMNANALEQNAPGIDLIDQKNKIIVQVSSDKGFDKVQKSLNKSAQYQGFHFYFVAIAEKVSLQKTLQIPSGLQFDQQKDIFSVTQIQKIVLNSSIDKQKALYELTNQYLTSSPDSSAALRAALDAALDSVRENHPSFWLMKPDKIDQLLFPGSVEIQPFEAKGTQEGDQPSRPVWERIMESWQAGKNHSIIMEGEGGIGKTVTLLSPPADLPIPAIYIHLYELVHDGHCLSVSDWLDAKMLGWAKEIDVLAMHEWNGGPSLLLLLDGVNEIAVEKRREVLNRLADWNSTHPGAQLIVVSRPLDESSLQGVFPQTLHIKLEPLSKETVVGYLREHGQEPPDDASPVWNVLCRPLFLTLYAKTGRIVQKEAAGYPLDFRGANGPGAIIWNYFQRELLRFPDAGWVLRCAVACEYVFPAIAYDMVKQNIFTIERDRAFALMEQALSMLRPERLPKHLTALWSRYDDENYEYPSFEGIDWRKLMLRELDLLWPESRNAKTKRFAFIHQTFRDCLAGVYLINQAEIAGEGELPEVWQHGQSYLALDYAAELMNSETADQLWDTNRAKQQYDKPGFVKDNTATYALLELQKRRRPLPDTLDFSGMDLRGVSLARYMWQFGKSPASAQHMGRSGKALPLFREAYLTKDTLLDRATFQSEGHTGQIISMALLSDGRMVSGSSDYTLRVWDINTGECLQTLKGHKSIVSCVSVLPDGHVVSGSSDYTLRVWDAATGQCLQTLEGHKHIVSCLSIFPDGRVVSGAGDSINIDTTLRVWNVVTGQCLQILEGHQSRVTCVSVLPDERVISGSEDTTLRVWDIVTGKCLQTLVGHKANIDCVSVLPDGHVVSGSADHTLRVWDVASGQCLQTLEGHKHIVSCLSVFPDGRVVSGSYDHTLRVWDTTTGICLQTLEGHKNPISCVTILPNGRIVSGSYDHTLRVWDAATGRNLQTLEGHWSRVTCVTGLPDGHVISGSEDTTLRVWDVATGQCLQTMGWYKNTVEHVSVLPEGHVVSGVSDNTLRVCDATKGHYLHTLEGHSSFISCVSVLPDRRLVSGSDDNTLRVWDVATGQCLQTMAGHLNRVICVSILPDRRVVSGSRDKTLRIWDADTGQCLQTLVGHQNCVTCVTVLPDGRVVSGSSGFFNSADNTLRVWDVATGKCLQTMEGHKGPISCVTVLPDGQVVSGSSGFFNSADNTLRVWDVATGKCLQTLEGHKRSINCVAILPDGRLISGSEDGTLRVWDSDSGKCQDVLEAMEVDVSKMDLSQAILKDDLPKLLWQNGATITQKN